MKICPNCQHQSSDDSLFCMNCGASLSAAPAAEPVAAEPVVEPAPAPVAEPAPAPAPSEPQPVAVPAPAPQPYAPQNQYAQQPYSQPYYNQQPPAYAAPVAVDPYDHTAEFDAQDISDHKVYCMLCYLLGTMGIIIALLAGKDSPYTQFHVRTAIKFTVVETLTVIATLLLSWTVIFALAGGIFLAVLFVLQIICFFQICGGKAKDPAIIRSLKFLQ